MPSLAVPTRTRMVEGLAVVERRRSDGFVAKSLTIEIVTWTAGCFAHSPGAFLLMYQHARDSVAAGHLMWAVPVGRVGPKAVYLFCGKIEIAFYFNSELNFDN